LIYKCGGIDKRTIEKFEKVSLADFPLFFPASLRLFVAACYPSVTISVDFNFLVGQWVALWPHTPPTPSYDAVTLRCRNLAAAHLYENLCKF